MRPVNVGTVDKKNRQFLARPAETWYCLFQKVNKRGWRFLQVTGGGRDFGVKRGRLAKGAASH